MVAVNDAYRVIPAADVRSDELGKAPDGTPYTHVGFTSTGETAGTAMLIGMDARFSNDTIAGEGGAGI